MRILFAAIILVALAVLPVRAEWTRPCFVFASASASDGTAFRTIQNASAGAGWSLSSTTPVTMTVTSAFTTTTSLLGFTPHTIAPDDLEIHAQSEYPFTLYHCAPGMRPYTFIPVVR
jgi:hypothetical protein